MKLKIVYSLVIIVGLSFILSSYHQGAAAHGGYDCSGGESGLSNPTGCSTGGGCHANSVNTGITVAIELDSAGIPVTNYKAGLNYTIKLTGTNTTANNLPTYGFQLSATVGTTELVTPTNAGTFGTAPASTQVSAAQASYYVLNIFEQSTQLAPTSGTGGNGTVYSTSIAWTAPAAGTGSISLWAALNAVNNDSRADAGDLWNVAHVVIGEDTVAATHVGINEIATANNVTVYANPVTDVLKMQWNNAQGGDIAVAVYSVTGQLVTTQTSPTNNIAINTAAWATGVYFVSLEQGNAKQTLRILKQ